MPKLIKLLALFIIISTNISCTADNVGISTLPEEVAPAEEVKETEAEKYSAETDKEDIVGKDVSKELSEISVKLTNGKTKTLLELLDSRKTVVILVKPGCSFCESFLAVMNSSSPKIKTKLMVIMDKAHSSWDTFQKKAQDNSAIKAEWVYDEESLFKSKLAVKSFPRFIVLDKKGVVEAQQIGLLIPEDKSVLDGKTMPEAIQILSLGTIDWIKGL
jgi:thioredoxin-related protein